MFRAIACLLLVATASVVTAEPLVYSSPMDDSVNVGVVYLPESEVLSLNLYFSPGEAAYDYVASLGATQGLEILSYEPDDPAQVYSLGLGSGGFLNVSGGSFLAFSTAVRLGRLSVRGLEPGAVLDVLSGEFTTLTFDTASIPQQRIASVVFEPSLSALMSVGGLMGLLRARSRRLLQEADAT